MDGEQKEVLEIVGDDSSKERDFVKNFRDKDANSTEFPVSQEKKVERLEGAFEKDSTYHKILSQFSHKSSTNVDKADISADAKNINAETDYESKIEKLVSIAENKGVVHAVKVAKHLEDNYVLDELHDRLLADDLHVALVKKGIIKEV